LFCLLNINFNSMKKKNIHLQKVLVISPRQKLFFQFASVEYNGMPYMTPQDFLESVTEDHPRRNIFDCFSFSLSYEYLAKIVIILLLARIRRKILTKENLNNYLKHTPERKKGSNRLFRNLEDRGIISYSEYLFLLCVITSRFSFRNYTF